MCGAGDCYIFLNDSEADGFASVLGLVEAVDEAGKNVVGVEQNAIQIVTANEDGTIQVTEGTMTGTEAGLGGSGVV